jgi:hypothetical protein
MALLACLTLCVIVGLLGFRLIFSKLNYCNEFISTNLFVLDYKNYYYNKEEWDNLCRSCTGIKCLEQRLYLRL